jgi:hypothetical protein
MEKMFKPEHMIWKAAYYNDELGDWLDHAEYLIEEWSKTETVKFQHSDQIFFAALLMMDDLLPVSARKAFAKVTLETMTEAKDKKYKLDALHIEPPKPGRKEDRVKIYDTVRAVHLLLVEGKSKSEAYNQIAEEQFKSPDTIRRLFERAMKKSPRLAEKMAQFYK